MVHPMSSGATSRSLPATTSHYPQVGAARLAVNAQARPWASHHKVGGQEITPEIAGADRCVCT